MKNMRRMVIGMVFALSILSAQAQQDTLKYRICLKDKAATEYRLDKPEAYLSAKAIERRKRQGLAIDSTDLPVCAQYVDAIRQKGVHVVLTGKWENFVTVSCNDTATIGRIASLPFVRSVEKVWTRPAGGKRGDAQRDSLINRPDSLPGQYYGAGEAQIRLSQGDKLHEAGFRGQGMTVAVIDAGYHNADRITAFDWERVLGTKDFVDARADLFALYYIMDNKLVELGVIPSLDVAKAEYNNYIRNGLLVQLTRIKPGCQLEEAHMRNRQAIAAWAYEKGKSGKVIERMERDGKTYFVIRDYLELRNLFGQLLREVQRIKSEGDYEAAREFIETYGVKVDKSLHEEVLSRYAKLGVAPYAGFINPEYQPVMEDGHMVDVRIVYPDDFLTQMLAYGE